MNVETTLTDFVQKHLLARADRGAVGPDESLIACGLLDSLAVVELTAFVEQAFGIKVEDEDVVPANFETIQQLAAFVDRKRKN
jgi:acyl carrier protein